MPTRSNDKVLLMRLRAGEEAALEELSAVHGGRVSQLAFKYLRNREDAEEVTQDVLYQVFRKASSFRGDAALSSWIYRITFNAAMSRLRTARHRQEMASAQLAPVEAAEPPAQQEIADWSDLADEQVHRSQLRRRALKAILALPAIYRAPVVLRDLQGLSTEEASARLRVKDQTLKSRLHRGRLILRRQLADFANGLTLHPAA